MKGTFQITFLILFGADMRVDKQFEEFSMKNVRQSVNRNFHPSSFTV